MEAPSIRHLRELAQENRVLLLGGHAIIFHGHERPTADVDIWLDSSLELRAWCEVLQRFVERSTSCHLWDLAERRRLLPEELPDVIQTHGVVRIGGLEEPLDVFRRPNNFEEADFSETWERANVIAGERVRVFSATDLLASKADTERQKDRADIVFLESRIRAEFTPLLQTCSLEEAERLFARYADQETCRAALSNPNLGVRSLALETLREFAANQNPFAREMLQELGESEREQA